MIVSIPLEPLSVVYIMWIDHGGRKLIPTISSQSPQYPPISVTFTVFITYEYPQDYTLYTPKFNRHGSKYEQCTVHPPVKSAGGAGPSTGAELATSAELSHWTNWYESIGSVE